MTEEQFEQIIVAIREGKYSWACVLILRFSGYNPLHYIPLRTYRRIARENRKSQKLSKKKPETKPSDLEPVKED